MLLCPQFGTVLCPVLTSNPSTSPQRGEHGPFVTAVPTPAGVTLSPCPRAPWDDGAGESSLQDLQTQPRTASGRPTQKITPHGGTTSTFPSRANKMKETSSAAREKSLDLQISTQRSVVGEVPPSHQLPNHRRHLPNQPANCKGFVSAGLSGSAFCRGRRFC